MQRKLQAEKQRKGRGRGKPAKTPPFLEPLVIHGGQRLELARFGYGRQGRLNHGAHPPVVWAEQSKQTSGPSVPLGLHHSSAMRNAADGHTNQ